jgi:hypothetical protein
MHQCPTLVRPARIQGGRSISKRVGRYGRARVHWCTTLVRPARQQGGVQILRPCLGSSNDIMGSGCPQRAVRSSQHHWTHTTEATQLGVNIRRSRVWPIGRCRCARGPNVHAELTWQATFRRDSIAYIPLMDANSLWLGARMHSARADHNTLVCCTVPAKGAAAAWSNCHPITGAPRTRTYITRKHTWMTGQGSVHSSLRPVWASRCAGCESDPPSWRASLSASISPISAPFGLETCDSCSRWTLHAAAAAAAPTSPRLGHLRGARARPAGHSPSCGTTPKTSSPQAMDAPGVCAVVDLLTANRRRLRAVAPLVVSTRDLGIAE